MEIKYVKGDATSPIIVEGKKSVIVHCVNTLGAWGKGFVVPLGQKYPQSRKIYNHFIQLHKKGYYKSLLGLICIAPNVSKDIDVVNLFGQERIYPIMKDGEIIIPLDYIALRKGFETIVDSYASEYSYKPVPITVHMPRIGCGLAGGDWNKVEKIINETLIDKGIEVYVYDLK